MSLNQAHDQLSRILSTRWKETILDKPAVLYLTTHDTSLETTIQNFAGGLLEEPFVYIHQIQRNCTDDPYAPFLSLIRDWVRNEQINCDTLLTKVPVYPPHKHLFSAWIEGGIPERRDIIFPNEILYEQERLRQSVFALLRYISHSRPILVAVTEMKAAGPSMLQFARYLSEKAFDGKLLFIFSWTNTYLPMNPEQQEEWDTFTSFVAGMGGPVHINTEIPAGPSAVISSSFDLDTSLIRARLNLAFQCYPEVVSGINEIRSRLAGDTVQITPKVQSMMMDLLGDGWYYLRNWHQALICYQNLGELAERSENNSDLLISLRKIGLTYLGLNNFDAAWRHSLLLLNKLNQNNENEDLLYAWFLTFLISTRTCIPMSKDMYFRLMAILKRSEYENMYASFCSSVALYSSFFSSHDEIMRVIDESIKYYRSNGNDVGLSSAYHKKAIFYSNKGEFDESLKMMEKTVFICEKHGNSMDLIRITNGIGYTQYLAGNYRESYVCFRKSLLWLEKTGDYEEISITLFNLGKLYYCTGDYQRSAQVMDQLLKILYILGIRFIPFNTVEDVYLTKGLCMYKCGKLGHATEMVTSMNFISDSYPWKTRFLYFYLCALIEASEHNFDDAVSIFNKAKEVLNASDDTNTDTLPDFLYEYAHVLLKAQRSREAEELIEQGLAVCAKLRTDWQAQRLRSLRDGANRQFVPFGIADNDIDLDSLITLAHKEAVLGKLQNKIRDFRFLNIIQSELMRQDDRKGVAIRLLKLVSYQFPTEFIAFYMVDANHLTEQLAVDFPNEVDITQLERLFTVVLSIQHNSCLLRSDLNRIPENTPVQLHNLYTFPIICAEDTVACLFLGGRNPDATLTESDREILVTAASQLGVLFAKVQLEEKILKQSREDPLSGLFNRKALSQRFAEETLRFRSYRSGPVPRLTIAFFDLDNFKYYNDTFGHAVGDCIIVEFAKLLRQNFREVDFIARYGGDEFIVLIPDTDCEVAKTPVLRIFSALEKAHYFLPEISHLMNKEICVPAQNLVSCSIGMTSCSADLNQHTELETFILQADTALNKAKTAGRHQLMVWETEPEVSPT